MNEQNEPKRCLECGDWVGEERERLQVQACMQCLPPIPPPQERPGHAGRVVAELTSGKAEEVERVRAELRATLGPREPLKPDGHEFAPGCFEREPVDLRVGPRERDEAVERAACDDADDCAACGEPAHVGDACKVREIAPGIVQPGTPPGVPRHPPIVTLCGSTRFRRAFETATYELTLEGWAVLSVGCFARTSEDMRRDGLTPAQKEELDALHLKKIAMSQRVHVLNVGGYIGESTTREIGYAFARKVPISFLEAAAGEAWIESHTHQLGALVAQYAGPLVAALGGPVQRTQAGRP